MNWDYIQGGDPRWHRDLNRDEYYDEDGKNQHEKFMNAIKEGNLEEIKSMGFKYNNATIGIIEAIYLSKWEIVQYLIEQKADLYEAMARACAQGKLEVVKYLIEKGVSFEKGNGSYHPSPLQKACEKEQMDIVKYLVEEKKATIHSSFYLASCNGHLKIVEYFISRGALKNKKDNMFFQSDPGLSMACSNGHWEVAKLLVENGANFEVTRSRRQGCLGFSDGATPLVIAAEKGNWEFCKFLVSKGANLKAKNQYKETAFDLAVKAGIKDVSFLGGSEDEIYKSQLFASLKPGDVNFAKIKELIESGKIKNVDIKDNDGLSPLMLASKVGYLDIVEYLLSKGANVNLQDYQGKTALIHSCDSRSPFWYVARRLGIEKGVLIDKCDSQKVNALMLACGKGHLGMVKYFIETCGANPHLKIRNGGSPYGLAIMSGSLILVKYLLEIHKVDINDEQESIVLPKVQETNRRSKHFKSSVGDEEESEINQEFAENEEENLQQQEEYEMQERDMNLIEFTAKSQYFDICEYLIINGAKIKDIVDGNDHSETAAYLANKKQWDILNLFASKGGKVDGALSFLIREKNDPPSLQILKDLYKKYGVDKNAKCGNYSALIYAAEAGNIEATKFLLEIGSDINSRKENTSSTRYGDAGTTPLLSAASGGHIALVELLIKAGADTNISTYSGNTLVHCAANSSNLEMIKKYVNVDKDKILATDVLIIACSQQKLDIVRYYIEEKNVDVNGYNNKGKTPLITACYGGSVDLVSYLLEHGASIELKALVIPKKKDDDDNDGWRWNRQSSSLQGETPLLRALEYGNEKIAALLLDKGANVDAGDELGITPLIFVATKGRLADVKFLLSRGANKELKAKNDKTALEHAQDAGHTEVCLFLDPNAKVKVEEEDPEEKFQKNQMKNFVMRSFFG